MDCGARGTAWHTLSSDAQISSPLPLPPLVPATQVDQAELETVVPQPGGTVLVLNGPYRGLRGSLQGIDTSRFQVRHSGARAGSRALSVVAFEHAAACTRTCTKAPSPTALP